MKKTGFILSCLLFLFNLNHALYAQTPIEHKSFPWFKQSFLDLSEDMSDAKEANKGLILYFHQQGCPYCKKLLNDNFTRPKLVNKLRNQYDFIAINMWGDKSVVDLDGEQLTEKSLAVKLKVMFTPTLVFLNGQSKQEFRLNGYYSPEKFNFLLDYLALKNTKKITDISFSQFYKKQKKNLAPTEKVVQSSTVKIKNFHQLASHSSLPLMVLFEEENCAECDEMYQLFRNRKEISQLLRNFSLSKASIYSKQAIVDVNGNKSSYSQWSEALKIQYTPTLVFFVKDQKSAKIKEVFRVDSYLRAFHLESALLYVAEKHYIQFPEFQRYIHERVDMLEQQGIKIDLWK